MVAVKVVDTTVRDGQQSLVATRIKTEDILPVVEILDEAGFYAMEVWGGATFDSCLRYLGEDPWERLRLIKEKLHRTKAAMLLRGQNLVGYKHYPDDVVERFIVKAYENGVDLFRIFDALNDVRNVVLAVKTARRVGAEVHGDIVYTRSPVHTLEKYLEIAGELAALEVDAIRVKDMAGLLAPRDAYELVKEIRRVTGLPVALHCHYTCGLAAVSYLRGLEAGAEFIDTAVSPFAYGTSQPAVEAMYEALQGTPYELKLDMEIVHRAAELLKKLRVKYAEFASEATDRVDPAALYYQIPGGMMSNLVAQLREYNALDKLEEVLKEVPRVRADLGYPPLVTPLSQIVGTQAVINVLTGERYKVVIKELENYVMGLYGRPPGEISEEVKKRVLDGRKPIECRPADLLESFMDRIPEEVRRLARREEDLLSYALFPQQALALLRGEAPANANGKPVAAAPALKANPGVRDPSSKAAAIPSRRGVRLKVTVDGEPVEVVLEEF